MAADTRSELRWFTNGGRAEDDSWFRSAVEAHQTAEPAQNVCDMSAKHATKRVKLVDHDKFELLQKLGPAAVVCQDRLMHHLGVGEQHVGVSPYPGPLLGGAVSVVGGGSESGNFPRGQGQQLVPS